MFERMTAKQYREEMAKKASKGKNAVDTGIPQLKYRNVPTIEDGIRFDSKKESQRYLLLKLLEKAGQITNLRLQVKYELSPGVQLVGEKNKRHPICYVADFVYFDVKLNREIVEDVKSHATSNRRDYRMKKQLMKTNLGLDIIEV